MLTPSAAEQNHIGEKGPLEVSNPISCWKQGTQGSVQQVLNINNWDVTPSPGSSSRVWPPSWQFVPLISGQNLSCSNLCLLPLLLSQHICEKSLVCAPDLTTSVALLDLLLYATVLVPGIPNQTPITRSHERWAEGRDPSFCPASCIPANTAWDALSLCCLGTLLAPGQLVVHLDPQVLGLVFWFGFFAKLLIKQSAPSLLHCKGLFHPRCRPLHQPLLSFLRLFSARFSSPSQSPWTAVLLSSVFTAMPNLVLSTHLLVVCSIPSFKPWIRC